ncbi:hypothetical protein KBD61_00270 [Patescibacteria group bacterium]|nr:hypothetical protein [Patescibacteria group bacterium]MBP9709445.1 hypothetical protein [Patescibacteria group bacterium]
MVTQLERLNAEDSLLNKHGVEKEFLIQLEQLAGEDLSAKDEEELDVWQKTAEAAIERLFPLLQEAHEIHQSKQDRIKNLRERHHLSEVERLEELVLELLPPDTSVEKRIEIRNKRDILKKGKRVSKEYRAKGDSTNAPSFCEYESDSGEKMGGVAKESLREGAKGFMPYEDDGQLHLSERIIDPETGTITWKKHDYGGVNKDSKVGVEAVRQTNNLITFLTSQMLEDGVKELLAKEAGTSPENISYDNSVGNARVSVLPGESTVREVMQSWVDMMVDFEVVPITVMRPEEDGTDVASIQENVTYHESVADPDSPLIAHQLSDMEADWFFDTPPSYWGEILKASNPDEPMEEDPE